MEQRETIQIDGEEYVRKASVQKNAEELDGMEYVVIRTHSAGVHAGYLKSRKKDEVELVNTRRIWYWDGAATLSQLARDGVTKPNKCRFSVVLNKIVLLGAIEVIPVTEKARVSIRDVAEWKAN